MSSDLVRLRDALARLLENVEHQASATSVDTATAACNQAFDELGAVDASRDFDVAERELLKEIVRLQSLVQTSIGREQTEIRSALRLVREAKRSTEYYVPEGKSGRSCDVSG